MENKETQTKGAATMNKKRIKARLSKMVSHAYTQRKLFKSDSTQYAHVQGYINALHDMESAFSHGGNPEMMEGRDLAMSGFDNEAN